jgi:hypothetical protein
VAAAAAATAAQARLAARAKRIVPSSDLDKLYGSWSASSRAGRSAVPRASRHSDLRAEAAAELERKKMAAAHAADEAAAAEAAAAALLPPQNGEDRWDVKIEIPLFNDTGLRRSVVGTFLRITPDSDVRLAREFARLGRPSSAEIYSRFSPEVREDFTRKLLLKRYNRFRSKMERRELTGVVLGLFEEAEAVTRGRKGGADETTDAESNGEEEVMLERMPPNDDASAGADASGEARADGAVPRE